VFSLASSAALATLATTNSDGDVAAERTRDGNRARFHSQRFLRHIDPSAMTVEAETDWEFLGLKLLDAVVLRPLGVLTTAGGLVIFLVSTPFVAPAGKIGTAWDIFVYGPFDETFVVPLGEF
jgi:hypothetical protein